MKNVQDIYPVSPMQEVMLLHTMTHPENDTLFNQFCYRVGDDIDVAAFRRAWDATIARHQALRTAFMWEGINRPVQVVRRNVEMPFEMLDWSDRDQHESLAEVERLLEDDRRKGFDLRRAPLMRISMCRLADRSWYLVWCSHHLIIDRFCIGLLFDDLNRNYTAIVNGSSLRNPPAPSFRSYIDWLQQQNPGTAESYWRNVLRHADRATRTAPGAVDEKQPGSLPKAVEASLSGDEFDELVTFVRTNGLTMSTVAQGALALALNRMMQTQDVIFGATVAGRPAAVPGVDSIIGSFVGNVPVRIRLPSESDTLAWLREIHAEQFRRSEFEYVAPAFIDRCGDLEDGEPLFEILLVWLAGDDSAGELPLQPVSANYATTYPLTVSIRETGVGLDIHVERSAEHAAPVAALLDALRLGLSALAAAAGTRLADIPEFCREQETTESPEESGATPLPVSMTDDNVDEHVSRGREAVDRNLIQSLLASEWQRVLGPLDFRADSDFFESGGTSLQAARLHARIEAAIRRSVPLLSLFRDPTIPGMADTLVRNDWPIHSGVSVGLRTRRGGGTLFCVASPEVSTVGYSLLARRLADSENVYVLQSPPDRPQVMQMRPAELPHLARRYIAAMREIQPDGPYRLVSMCAGSHIAVEMARQLEAEAVPIEFIGIINTWSLYTVSRLYYLYRALNICKYYFGRLREFVPLISGKPEPVLAPAAAAGAASVVPSELEEERFTPWLREVGFEHLDPGRPKIDSTVTVFRIRPQQRWRIRDEGLGWSKQANSVVVVRIPGNDHHAILREPQVQDLARAVNDRLQPLLRAGEVGK